MQMQHLMVDGLASNLPLLRDGAALCAFLQRLVTLLSMEIMSGPLVAKATHFGPLAGVPAVVIISESHVAIHTWPEREDFNFNIDVFSCRPFDTGLVLHYIGSELRPTQLSRLVVERPLRGA